MSVGQSVGLSVCPSVCLSVCPSVGLSVCWSVRLSVCWSVRLSVFRSVGLSVCPSVRLPVCRDLTPIPIDLHEVRLEVCIQNSKTFIRTQHTGTRESPKLSCARSTPALASHKTQKLFIRTQHTGTRESLHEKMAGNPKTSEARREESRNRPNP